MRITKPLAALASTALLASVALVAAAGPAAAIDEGPVLPGAIYWFTAAGPLATQSAAAQTTSGSGTGRPWVTLTTENACPAGSNNMVQYLRIPQTGVPENDWVEVQMGAITQLVDADGRYYTTATNQADRLSKAEVLAYNVANGGSGTFPFLAVCKDAAGNSLGNFKTSVTVTGTVNTAISWSVVAPAFTGGGGGTTQTATTTTLTATGQGADLLLSAAVAPAAAAGDVTFKEGTTTLGTAAVSGGVATFTVTAPTLTNHTYTADFVPTDAAAYGASQGSASVAVGVNASGQIVVTIPAAPVVDGALTFSVPFDTPVALAGARDSANTRITAAGAFPTVTVTDTRRDGLLGAWEVNAQATDFTGSGVTIGAKYLGWTPSTSYVADDGSPLVTQAGGLVASFLDNTASAGLASSALLGKSATPGRGVATLNAGLALAIPAGTTQGTYTSTVTVTLVSS